jgi:hypothetical protein
MASAYHHPFAMDQFLQQSMNVDSRRSFFDDDESILDENILDSTLDVLPVDRRRESALDTNAIFSPTHNDWDFDHDMGMPAGPADDSAPGPAATFEHSNGTNNPFIKLEQAQPAYAQHNNWSSTGASGSCTPTVYDNNAFPNGGYDDSGSYLAPAMSAQGAFDNNTSNIHIPPHAVFQASAPSIPSSPAVKDWSAGPVDHEGQSMAKRVRPSSPGPRAHSPLHVRRDGIRKKNARFDIPAERTLMNIDQLIARSQDENEIKELKQQKRLLRNRQAALDSRQRKKQHTERLEEEKKLHSAVIQELEDKLQQMTMQEGQMRQRLQEMARERDILAHNLQREKDEKEEIVRFHTLQTGELRKKNTHLHEQLAKMEEALERSPMVHQNGSAFSDAFDFEADFDLDTNCWNDPMPIHEVTPTIKSEKVTSLVDSEKPTAPGILLILLLCGAFVASSKSSTPSLPPLPKQLQTASESVLQNIFQEAGVAEASRVETVDASTNSESWVVAKSDVPHMVGLESTMSVLNSFDKPTLEQQHEQFLQLTPAEYNDVTSVNFLREPEPVNQRSRRRIHENLATMRNNKPSAAEVYTRSLLWDRVDAEVVRRFAAFARQAQSAGGAASNEESSGAAACHS